MNLENIVGKTVEMVVNEDGGKQSALGVRFDLIPAVELFEIAKVLAEGADKYGPQNWQKIPTFDHINHCLSHVYAYLAGDTSDDHIPHALCRLLFASYTSKREAQDHNAPVEWAKYQRLIEYCVALEQQVEAYRSSRDHGTTDTDLPGQLPAIDKALDDAFLSAAL